MCRCWRCWFADIRHTTYPFWCVVLEVYRHTPTQNTSNTTYHCYVVLDTKYLQHDIPLVCRVGGLPTYTTQNISNTTYHWCVVLEVYRHTPIKNTSNTTYHWCVVLEAYRHTQHKIPPTRHTIRVSCWRYTDIHQRKIPPTRHTIRVSCWRLTDIHNTKYLQHDIPFVCRVGGLPTYTNTKYLQHDVPLVCRVEGLPTYTNTKYLQHDIPLMCRVGGLPTYTTQNTSNTTYHSCVVLEVYRHTPTQNTSHTTYHWCIVLEAYRHTQHKIPPTRHTIVMSCWRFTDIHNTKYLQHDMPLVCRVCSHLSTIVHMIYTVPQRKSQSSLTGHDLSQVYTIQWN